MPDASTRDLLLLFPRTLYSLIRRQFGELSSEAEYVFKIVVLLALPFPLFYHYGPELWEIFNIAGRHILALLDFDPNSVYGWPDNVQTLDPTSDAVCCGYIYLPSFAVLIAILIAPIYLPFLVAKSLGIVSPTPFLRGLLYSHGMMTIGFLFYFSILLSAYLLATLCDDWRKQVGIVGLVPILSISGTFSGFVGPQILMVALAVAGIKLAASERWLPAAFLIGFSTFKYIGIPFAIVLFGAALATRERRAITQTVLGGLLSQVPNILYFMLQPDELVFILNNYSHLGNSSGDLSGVFQTPIKEAGLEAWYLATGYPLVALAFAGLGIGYVAWVRTEIGLLGGFTIGFFATSYLIPSYNRGTPFLLFTLVLAFAAIDFAFDSPWDYLMLVFLGRFVVLRFIFGFRVANTTLGIDPVSGLYTIQPYDLPLLALVALISIGVRGEVASTKTLAGTGQDDSQ